MFLLDLGKGCSIHTHNTGKGYPTQSNCRGDEQTGGGHGSGAQYGHHSAKNFYKITEVVNPNCGLCIPQKGTRNLGYVSKCINNQELGML